MQPNFSNIHRFSAFSRSRSRIGTDITHTHAEIEIHFCEDGDGFFRSGNATAPMVPGLITAISGSSSHQVTSRPGKEYCRSVVHIPPKLLDRALSILDMKRTDFLPGRDKPIVQYKPRPSDYGDLVRIYRQIDRKLHAERGHLSPLIPLYVAELIYVLSHASEKTNVFERVSPHDQVLINRAHEATADGRHANLSVTGLAQLLGVTRAHLWRVFINALGISPQDYLLERQMEFAKEQLILGKTVTDIAKLCGYSNTSSFSRAFKSYEGVSPSIYIRTFSGSHR